jgi:hypothetical protein
LGVLDAVERLLSAHLQVGTAGSDGLRELSIPDISRAGTTDECGCPASFRVLAHRDRAVDERAAQPGRCSPRGAGARGRLQARSQGAACLARARRPQATPAGAPEMNRAKCTK